MGAASSLASLGLNLALSKVVGDQESDRLKSERKAEIRRIQSTDEEARRQQAAALQRRIAEQRARAGASGVGGVGGSIDAVVRGLTEESSAAAAASAAQTKAKIGKVNQSYGRRESNSLLDFNNSWLGVGSSLLGGSRSGGRSLLD